MENQLLTPTELSSKVGLNELNWASKPFHLFAALEERYKKVNIVILSQELQTLSIADYRYFEHISDGTGLVRSGFLVGDHNPCVYTKVVVPNHVYYQNSETLDNLGSRPIGRTLLYNKPNIRRSEFKLTITNSYVEPDLNDFLRLEKQKLITRSSVFYKDERPYLKIYETILPNIVQY